MEVGEEGDYIPIATLPPPECFLQQNKPSNNCRTVSSRPLSVNAKLLHCPSDLLLCS